MRVLLNLIFFQVMSTTAILPGCTLVDKSNSKDNMAEKGFAFVNGINMYYEVVGQGEPLVLIHGGGSTIETTFGRIRDSLAQHYSVIAMDLQAHGRTQDRNQNLTFDQDADDVYQLLRFLKIEKANVMGFSNGGNTAMRLAIQYPECVDKLIVASSFYRRDGLIDNFFEGMRHASLVNMPQPLKEAFLKVNPDTSKLQVMHDKDRDRMLAFNDWRDEDLGLIKSPTLIIIGQMDIVKHSHAEKMANLIPEAEYKIVKGGHGSYIGEVCAEFDEEAISSTLNLILAFLES